MSKFDAPHFTEVAVAQFVGTLVGEFDKARVLFAHRDSNLSPAGPVLEQLVIVANVLHELFKLGTGEAVVTATVLAGTVGAFHRG